MVRKEKLGRLCKERMIDEIVSRIKAEPNFVITSYMGSSVSDLEALRKNLKKISSEYVVVKNSILKIVFEKLKLESETQKIEGGMGLSLSGDDIFAACRTLTLFAKDHDKFKIKGAVIEGRSITTERVREFATFPSKEMLLALVVGGIKSPITGFVNILGGILRKFVYVVAAIKTSKQNAGTASAGVQATSASAETKS